MVSFLSLKGRVWTGYVLAFLLLLVSYFLIYYSMQRAVRATNSVTHTYSFINKLEELRGEITEAETGIRGYVITHDDRFLAPYDTALQKIPKLQNELKALTASNQLQRQKLDTLMLLITERLKYMSDGLVAFRMNGLTITDNMRVSREPAKKIMDSIRIFSKRMANEEENMANIRKKRLDGFFNTTLIIAMVSLAIAFITLYYSLIVFNKEHKAKELAINRATGYSIILESNISELKEANLQLQELKNLEKFTATGRIARTIAHEVRNPLTNITLASEQLQESITPNVESTLLLEMISRNAARINELVAELLNATRFASLEFQKTDPNRLLKETLEMARDRIDLNHIRVVENYSAESCAVSVDAEKIKLAFLNIIVNAIEAMEKDKGVLQLNVRKQGDRCIIEIRDNGKGMDNDVLQNLFEPYFTGKSNGTGLGLTNSQNIIFNHKGTITVYSKPGLGATFIIGLNLVEE
jgi:signal transduction histidine kinase